MKVLVPHKILKSLQHENLRIAGKYEVGGVLLGYRRGKDIEIVNATFPSNGDKSSRNKFKRLSLHHQLIAMKFWKNSQKKIDWVGEWHTHPEKTPTPSTIDIKSWRQLGLVATTLPKNGQLLEHHENEIGTHSFCLESVTSSFHGVVS